MPHSAAAGRAGAHFGQTRGAHHRALATDAAGSDRQFGSVPRRKKDNVPAVSASIPIIDLSSLDDAALDGTAAVHAIESIAAAARDWGFFQVTGHGVSTDLVDRVWTQTHAFFGLPMAAKRALARTRENPRGYYDRELTKNRRDLKEVFDFAAVDGVNRWPEALPYFRETMLEYFAVCERLGLRLLGALCRGLGLDEDTLTTHFSPVHTGFARLNYYPLDDPLELASAATVTALGDMAPTWHRWSTWQPRHRCIAR